MKQASLSVFGDETKRPVEADLRRALGPAAASWRRLVDHVGRTYGPVTPQWNFGGARYGWSLRLRKGDRIVVYLIPQEQRWLAGVVLGAAAVAAARTASLQAEVLKAIDEAPRHAEGTGVRLPVRDERDVADVETLLALKMR